MYGLNGIVRDEKKKQLKTPKVVRHVEGSKCLSTTNFTAARKINIFVNGDCHSPAKQFIIPKNAKKASEPEGINGFLSYLTNCKKSKTKFQVCYDCFSIAREVPVPRVDLPLAYTLRRHANWRSIRIKGWRRVCCLPSKSSKIYGRNYNPYLIILAYQNRLRFNRAKKRNQGAPAWNPHDLVQATKGLANVHRAGPSLAKVLQILQQASLRKISLKSSSQSEKFAKLS